MTNPLRRVGFLGLGIMGKRMARNLARKGFAVTVWNRSPAPARELAAEGAGVTIADSPASLAANVDVFCTCVADPAALRDVTLGSQGLFETAKPGQVFIDFSTVSPELTRELDAVATAKGFELVEAPVTGSKNGAEKGTLLLMVGATPAAFERARPVFDAVGEKAIHVGPVGAGSQVKLAGNALIALMLQGLSEGFLLAAKAGVDPQKVLDVVQASGFRSPYFDFKGQALLRRDFETHFSIDLMFKDLNLFLESAAWHGVPAPTVTAVRDAYQVARAAGKGPQDITAVITAFEEQCGTRIG